MNIPVSFVIGLRYARASKEGNYINFISFFSVAGIVLGVMALITVISVMDGFEAELKRRVLGAVPHVIVHKPNLSTAEFTELLPEVSKSDKVEQVIPLIQSQAIIQLPSDLKAVLVQGVNGEADIPLGVQQSLSVGNWQQMFDTKYSVVIGRYLALEHGINLGDKVKLLVSGASHYTPIGRLPAQRNFTVVGYFQTDSEVDEQTVFTRARDLNRLMKKTEHSTAGVRLVLADAFDAEKVTKQISQSDKFSGTDISNWQDSHGNLFEAVKMEKSMMWFMLSLIIAVAAFNIVSALVMMVTKKQGEVAILKTLGLPPNKIKSIFIIQGAYKGIVGTLVGGVLGVVIAANLNNFMLITGINLFGPAGVGLPIDVNPLKVFYVLVFSLMLSILASIYPAINASQLKPAQVLRYE